MSNFISREFKKLIKNYKYDGVIWVYLPYENLENIDQELFEIIKLKKQKSDSEEFIDQAIKEIEILRKNKIKKVIKDG